MKLNIWGSEICGLVAGACFARFGNDVKLVVNDPKKGLDAFSRLSLNTEPGLSKLLEQQVDSGRITLCQSDDALQESVHLLAYRPNEKAEAEHTIKQLAKTHSGALLLISQSNFGIGTTDQLATLLNEHANQVISYVPESLPQGSGLTAFRSPQNLIFGSENKWALDILNVLFRPFIQASRGSVTVMTAREAEFTKFAITGMLALRLSYINELANLADNMHTDIDVIRNAMAADPRISSDYLKPGCGFGGLSFPQYLSGLAETLSQERNSALLARVLEQNETQKEVPFRKLWRHYNGELNGKTISIWGVSFKPDTSSMDNAPSIPIIQALLAQNARIRIHDPEALDTCMSIFGDGNGLITYVPDQYEAIEDSDGLLLLTEWNQYWAPDFDAMREKMATALVVDGRNVFDRPMLKSLGFAYYGVGR